MSKRVYFFSVFSAAIFITALSAFSFAQTEKESTPEKIVLSPRFSVLDIWERGKLRPMNAPCSKAA